MRTLREHIYTSQSAVAEAQHNVMHAVFVLLCSKPTQAREDLQQGLRIFNNLFKKHFKPNLEVRRAFTLCVILNTLFLINMLLLRDTR